MPRSSIAILCLLILHGHVRAEPTVAEAQRYAAMLKDDKDADHRQRAAEQLGRMGLVRVALVQPHTAILVAAFQADKDQGVRVAAGRALLVIEADRDAVAPAIEAVLRNAKEQGAVLAVAAQLATTCKQKDLVPQLESLKEREEARGDPKLRDQKLLLALNQALKVLDR